MINKFEAIKNIGNFEDYKASGDVTLKKMSFIYGENGSGKTTLARILYSLSLGDGSIIQRHKRIGSTSNSEVQIKDNTNSEQLVWLYSHCKQVIVLSHNLHFLIDLNGRRQIKKNEKKTLRIVNSRGESYIQEFELKKEWIDNYKKAITTMNNFVASPDPSNQEEAINSIRLSLETFLKLKFCRFITDQDQTFGDIVHQLEKSECSFVNADRQGVINKLNNLVAVSWRTHHGSVEERDLYTEQSFSMTEAINYVEMTLRLLEKEL